MVCQSAAKLGNAPHPFVLNLQISRGLKKYILQGIKASKRRKSDGQ